ncbi:MAG: phosphoenolpyruvate--protein phosphotransferase [Clostridiales bacterium]|nr:phosphoenolpyruvate--protein phosphotransferase [Clostridiales bacterium]
MLILEGNSVCGGIACGKIFVFPREEIPVKRVHIQSSDAEIARFLNAKETAKEELRALYKKAIAEVGKANAEIFNIHCIMLDDTDFSEAVENLITDQMINAETAVAQTCDEFCQMFINSPSSRISSKSADIRDISERVIRILSGTNTNELLTTEPSIILSDYLSPSEAVQFDRSKILGFGVTEGSPSSHTAILAKSMGIPALLNIKVDSSMDGKYAILDGFEGKLYIEPDEAVKAELMQKADESFRRSKLLEELKGKESISADGIKMTVSANITNPCDLDYALENDAEGIGLLRTEFFYAQSSSYPTEDMQFDIYKNVLTRFSGKRVVIRTLDITSDKYHAYMELPKEHNPALGMRSLRFSLENPQFLKIQLRALYRASVYGRLAILFPFVNSQRDAQKVLEYAEQVKSELKSEGIPFDDSVELGCLIETPAAAVISDILVDYMDFVSIGTNDLVQYTVAAERDNPELAKYFDTYHKGVLRLIKTIADNAHKAGKPVSICGAMGRDTVLTEVFLALGIDEVSVIPPAVLLVRQKIRNSDISLVKKQIIDEIINK